MNLNKKTVIIFGAGESGDGAASLLCRLGAKVHIYDKDKSKAEKIAINCGINCVDDKGLPSVMSKAYAVIVSPGIEFECSCLLMAKALGVKVIPELELADNVCRAKIVTVTGTNGKSSTVRLISSVLNACGKYSVCGGNIGTAFSRFADKLNEDDVAVIEASSFQLANIVEYHTDIAVLLNITEDHIDRHGSVDNYVSAKSKIFKNSKDMDFIVANYDDERVLKLIEKSAVKSKVFYFSKNRLVPYGVYISDGKIKAVIDNVEYDIGCISDISPMRTHLENALATIAVAYILKLPIGIVYRKIREFIPSMHTLQKICAIGNINYVDDSKGTNVSATLHAIDSIDGKLVLIVGGRGKGENYSVLFKNLPQKVEKVLFLGENANELCQIADDCGCKGKVVESMKTAVSLATKMLEGKGTVLFSPACASFDSYNDYKERGEAFIFAVNEYGEK